MDEILIKHYIKENLSRLRQINGFRQEDIAQALKIDRSTYASWESGRSLPKPVQLVKLSEIFDCSVDFLVNDSYRNVGTRLEADVPYKTDADRIYGDKYMIELTNEERALLLKFRLLNSKDKVALDEFLDNIRDEK